MKAVSKTDLKSLKAKMAALHPDKGGPGGKAFHDAYRKWKSAERATKGKRVRSRYWDRWQQRREKAAKFAGHPAMSRDELAEAVGAFLARGGKVTRA